ncbi:MAG: hypothetical protein V8Q82_08935 [Christensenellales bacterium]
MPFLTEKVYDYLPGCEEASCMLSDWPRAEYALPGPGARRWRALWRSSAHCATCARK